LPILFIRQLVCVVNSILYGHLLLFQTFFHVAIIVHATILVWNIELYRVSQEERAKLREGVPYVKLYRYNPEHLYPKLNGYGDNGQRSLKL